MFQKTKAPLLRKYDRAAIAELCRIFVIFIAHDQKQPIIWTNLRKGGVEIDVTSPPGTSLMRLTGKGSMPLSQHKRRKRFSKNKTKRFWDCRKGAPDTKGFRSPNDRHARGYPMLNFYWI